MVGYNGNFIHPLELPYKCPFCELALRDPMQTECGHRLCETCYEELKERGGKTGLVTCPVDKSIVLPYQVFPDMYAKREVLNLQTYCMFKQNHCQWEGSLRDFEGHVIECEYKEIACPNGCKQRFPECLMEQHLLNSCPNRIVECEYCKVEIKNSALTTHYDVCNLYPLDCGFNCGATKLPRKILKQHQEFQCPNVIGACAFSFCGCDFKGTKEEIAEHLQKEMLKHLEFAASNANSLEEKVGRLQGKLKIEGNRAAKLEQRVLEQGEELSSIRHHYSTLHSKLVSVEKEVAEVHRSGEKTKENLSLIQKKCGPTLLLDMESLKESARLAEEKINRATHHGKNVKFSQMNLSGPSSLPLVSSGTNGDTDKRIKKLESQIISQDVEIAELNLKLQLLESTSYDGKLLWKINSFHKRKQDAAMGKSTSLYSPPFYTSRFGYKMCARIYLNGDGQGRGTYISLFFVVMRGEYDAMLQWPFPSKITMKLLAQEGDAHIIEAFRPDPNSSSFRRPSSEMNIASGVPLFANQERVSSGPYIKNDCIFVKVIVDTSCLSNLLPF